MGSTPITLKSGNTGTSTSEAEVTSFSRHGLWLLVKEKEYFLAYEQYPWFKAATTNQLFKLQFLHGHHLHWPELDVDIDLDSLNSPEGHPPNLQIAKPTKLNISPPQFERGQKIESVVNGDKHGRFITPSPE